MIKHIGAIAVMGDEFKAWVSRQADAIDDIISGMCAHIFIHENRPMLLSPVTPQQLVEMTKTKEDLTEDHLFYYGDKWLLIIDNFVIIPIIGLMNGICIGVKISTDLNVATMNYEPVIYRPNQDSVLVGKMGCPIGNSENEITNFMETWSNGFYATTPEDRKLVDIDWRPILEGDKDIVVKPIDVDAYAGYNDMPKRRQYGMPDDIARDNLDSFTPMGKIC